MTHRLGRRNFIKLAIVCFVGVVALTKISNHLVTIPNLTDDQQTKSALIRDEIAKDQRDSTGRSAKLRLYSGIIEYEIVMRPSAEMCRGNNITVMVVSTPDHHERRTAVRKMWATKENLMKYGAAAIFVLSGGGPEMENATRRRLEDEQDEHGDLLLTSLVESYSNLTLKTLSLFTYALSTCDSTFIAKTDDDVIVNLDRISNDRHSVTGVCYDNNSAPVHRDEGDKWIVSRSTYARDRWPAYCSGGYYQVPFSAIGAMLYHARDTPIVHIEDVFMSGILTDKARVPVLSTDHFPNCYYPTPCNSFYKISYHRPNVNYSSFLVDWEENLDVRKRWCWQPLCWLHQSLCLSESCSYREYGKKSER